jgi:hypothetical protein
MALNTRPSFDPRFPFHHREVARGAMLCTGVLYRVTPVSPGTSSWNYLATDPKDRTPGTSAPGVAIYQGQARVQPNKDWRARKQSSRDETYVEHAVRIQLDFLRNELREQLLTKGITQTLNEQPVIRVGDAFKVTGVHKSLDGLPVDTQLMEYTYRVRNITSSSNSWVINLLCDNDVTKAVV